MLKIAELKAAAEAIDDEVVSYENLDSNADRSRAAWAAYDAERAKAMSLKAQYEAIDDENATGITNAGDTYGSRHGDIRFISTEFWNCAIESVVA